MLRTAFFGRGHGALWLFTGAMVLMTLAACGDEGAARPAVCDPTCSAGLTCCGAPTGTFCRATASDVVNCGGCGITCGAGETCSLGACVGGADGSVPMTDSSTGPGMCMPTCSAGQRCCGTSCLEHSVPVGTDGRAHPSFMNCNGCGFTCDPMTASACSSPGADAPRCMCGAFECVGDETCVNDGGAFRCANTQTDPNNCGAVGNVCAGEDVCVAGVCSCGSTGATCGADETCCAGACIDTQSDAANCGACGTVCSAAGPTCSAGSCRCGTSPACAEPSASALGASCCDDACVPNDNLSCGCGVACGTDTCLFVEPGGAFPIGDTGLCCGTPGFPPLFPGFCLGGGTGLPGGGGGDAGLPGFDGGLPFP